MIEISSPPGGETRVTCCRDVGAVGFFLLWLSLLSFDSPWGVSVLPQKSLSLVLQQSSLYLFPLRTDWTLFSTILCVDSPAYISPMTFKTSLSCSWHWPCEGSEAWGLALKRERGVGFLGVFCLVAFGVFLLLLLWLVGWFFAVVFAKLIIGIKVCYLQKQKQNKQTEG